MITGQHAISENEPPHTSFWGGWATIGMSALIMLTTGLASIVVTGAIVALNRPDLYDAYSLGEVTDINLLSVDMQMVVYWISIGLGIALMLRFIHMRGTLDVLNYLGVRPVAGKITAKWAAGTFIFYSIFVLTPAWIAANAGMEIPPQRASLLYFVTAVLAAPVFEESFFRGFMLAGLIRSRLGVSGAILFTSALWTFAHFMLAVDWVSQVHQFGVIFCFGVLLCAARLNTGSLVVPIALHAMWNATVLLVDALFITTA